MALKTKEKILKWVKHIYVYDEESPEDSTEVYIIDSKKKNIIFIPKDSFFTDKVLIEGFDKIPDGFSKNWYILSWLGYYLDKSFSNKKIDKFVISKDKKSGIRKLGQKKVLTLKYDDFLSIRKKLNYISSEKKIENSNFIQESFYWLFPKHFSKPSTDVSLISKKKVIENLDYWIIDKLDSQDIKKLLDFVEVFLSTKYASKASKHNLFKITKLKVDSVTITEIMKEFENHFNKKTSESQWGKFLQENLFLLDSRYIDKIPELGLTLAWHRKVDFWLVSVDGFLDIFEIKKPETKLLCSTPDRGNYYWHSDTSKAIVQIEKYLYNADRKASALTEDIKREKWVELDVIKPKAILLIWNSKQLNDDKKREDFRILRQSLKNIEIILYDELYDRLKNLKAKFYVKWEEQ